MKYRLLAIDVDGTLMNSRDELPAANRAALHEAHQAELTVCLCTGRTLSETRAVIEAIGLDSDVGVFVFGAVVSALPSGRTLHRTPIAEPVAVRIVEHLRLRGYPVLVVYDAAEAGRDYDLVRGERNVEAYQRWVEFAPSRWEEVDEWQPKGHGVMRVTIIEEPACVSDAMASLRREFPDGQAKINPIYAPNYGLHVVECFAPQVNKWHGIMQAAGPMGISAEEIAAIGDDINDLEMIREAGLGIAMGNAIELIREAARWQVSDNDDCGVAEAVRAIL